MTDTARQIYEGTNAPEDVQRLADDEEERLHLDFKERTTKGRLLKDKDALKYLAKALSGFSNADGGVLVLGVKDKTREFVPLHGFGALPPRAAYAAPSC